MHMHVCMGMYMQVMLYVEMYDVYVCTMHVDVCACMYACMYIHVCVSIHAWLCAYVCMNCVYVDIWYVCVCVYIHVNCI